MRPLHVKYLFTLLVVLFARSNTHACVAIAETGLIGVNHEDAVIIWDRAHQTEHFIRSVSLNTSAKDAGFLVPTPTTPELVTADMRIFNLAEEYFSRYKGLRDSNALPAASTNETAPQIVLEEDIGNYHAVVLNATDEKGLGDWLKANGYPWTDAAAQWLKPYLAAKWKITAFKFRNAGGGTVPGMLTSAIRMSFRTPRPFFPYREPAQAGQLSGDYRTLNIAFLGDQRVEGKLEDGTPWPAQAAFAGSTLDKNEWLQYAKLSGAKLPPKLTYFTDNSNPRPGHADLYFSPSPDQSNTP